MDVLFDADTSRISRHIKMALRKEEIDSKMYLWKTKNANSYQLVYLYDLYAIISIGKKE